LPYDAFRSNASKGGLSMRIRVLAGMLLALTLSGTAMAQLPQVLINGVSNPLKFRILNRQLVQDGLAREETRSITSSASPTPANFSPTFSGPGWLRATRTNSTYPVRFEFTIVAANLSPGKNTGTLVVGAPGHESARREVIAEYYTSDDIEVDTPRIDVKLQNEVLTGQPLTFTISFPAPLPDYDVLVSSSQPWARPSVNMVCMCRPTAIGITINRALLSTAPGFHLAEIRLSPTAPGVSRTTVDIVVEIPAITPSAPPPVSSVKILNAASGVAAIAPGSLVSIYGTDLMASTGSAIALPLPTRDANRAWMVENRELPLIYWSPKQVNALLPAETPVGAAMDLWSRSIKGTASVDERVTQFDVRAQTPGIFTMPNQDCEILEAKDSTGEFCPGALKYYRPALTDALTGKLITGVNPARLNKPLTLWVTGLGRSVQNPAGYRESAVKPSVSIVQPPELPYHFYGSQVVNVLFAGPTAAFPGLDQINFVIPDKLSKGEFCGNDYALELALVVRSGEVSSNTVRLPLQIRAGEIPCVQR
jgi:uncharacterized protein (TIGR03437 family)